MSIEVIKKNIAQYKALVENYISYLSKSEFPLLEELEAKLKQAEAKVVAYELKASKDLCTDCDSFKYLVDNDLENLWQISIHYKIDYNQLLTLNKHLDPNSMQKGDTVCLPKGTLGQVSGSKNYDSFIYMTDNDLKTFWAIAQHYGLESDDLIKINQHLNPSTMKKGDTIYLPAGTLKKSPKENSVKDNSTPNKFSDSGAETGGDPKGKKTFYISWSFDDGPAKETNVLEKSLNIDHSTWFIVKSSMLTKTGGWDKNVKRYLEFQKSGGEIGIHAQHKSIDHILWFPATKGTSYDTYSSIQAAMADIKTFKAELNKEGLTPKFVRLPGGLASQLQDYAKHFGFNSKNVLQVRNAILKEKDFKSLGIKDSGKKLETGYNKIAKDYTFFKSQLKSMKLLLWGGSNDPGEISAQSWEAESSGNLALNDNVTQHIAQKDKRSAWHNKYAGKFEKMVDKMSDGDTQSLVILAHDTSQTSINEILADKKQMETYAKKKGVRIIYQSMSELFKKITNEDPTKYTPDY